MTVAAIAQITSPVEDALRNECLRDLHPGLVFSSAL